MRIKNAEIPTKITPQLPKKYKIAIMLFEEDPEASDPDPQISHDAHIQEYKAKMKSDILQKISKKLSEINDSSIDQNSSKNEEKPQQNPQNIPSDQKITKEKDPNQVSSDDYEENEKTEENLNSGKVNKLEHYVNVWKSFSKYGEPIENTYIIPSKTFYMSKKAETLKGTPYYYSLIDCLKEHQQKGIKIEKIIDINYSNSYYNFNYLKKHYKEELFGVEYLKIPFTPKEIPSRKEVNRVYDILNKNISKKQYILIHCTHGVNRTGYVLIYFLCKRYEYSVEKAIEIFEKSRGHKFENKAFITDLKQKLK